MVHYNTSLGVNIQLLQYFYKTSLKTNLVIALGDWFIVNYNGQWECTSKGDLTSFTNSALKIAPSSVETGQWSDVFNQ